MFQTELIQFSSATNLKARQLQFFEIVPHFLTQECFPKIDTYRKEAPSRNLTRREQLIFSARAETRPVGWMRPETSLTNNVSRVVFSLQKIHTSTCK